MASQISPSQGSLIYIYKLYDDVQTFISPSIQEEQKYMENNANSMEMQRGTSFL